VPTRCVNKYQSSFQGYSIRGKDGPEFVMWRCRIAKQVWQELGVRIMAQDDCESTCKYVKYPEKSNG
jgi:hypothetical protein